MGADSSNVTALLDLYPGRAQLSGVATLIALYGGAQ
jgi:hypothetical protein